MLAIKRNKYFSGEFLGLYGNNDGIYFAGK